jgi:hypothetical protein
LDSQDWVSVHSRTGREIQNGIVTAPIESRTARLSSACAHDRECQTLGTSLSAHLFRLSHASETVVVSGTTICGFAPEESSDEIGEQGAR